MITSVSDRGDQKIFQKQPQEIIVQKSVKQEKNVKNYSNLDILEQKRCRGYSLAEKRMTLS